MACFDGAILTGTKLDGATLDQAILTRADASGASLKGASLTYADASHAKLVGTNFDGADARSMILHAADDRSANWRDARRDDQRVTDPALAAAETWQPSPD